MVYEYLCETCDRRFDVIKSYREMEVKELCRDCGKEAIRMFVPSRVYFNGTKVEDAEYNPGLGCIVRNSAHRKELAKRKGVEEIGNERPETIHKHFDKAREESWEKSWEDVDKGWVGNGQ